ncbi:MAG TPA: radical SAM protein [Vicinamibacteria bacterium]
MSATAKAALGARYAARLLGSRLRGGPLLSSAALYLTHRCNLRCVYCNSPFMKTPELTREQWLGVVDELAAVGCRRVAILGGEPTLRPDLPDIVDRARGHGLSCALTSNGLLTPRVMERLRGLDTLVLSLDAPGPANDAVRGAGVFEAVRAAIAAARRVGVPVKLNAVLSARTAPCLDDLLAFAEAEGLDVTVNVMRSGAADLWRDAATIKDDDGAIAALFRRLAALARSHPRLLYSPQTYAYGALWGDYGRDRFEEHELAADDPRRTRAPRCHAGRDYVAIQPDGTVYPCTLTVGRIPGGNVVRDGVVEACRPLWSHSCVACYSACQVEQNHLCSLQPRVVWRFVQRHLARYA